MFLPMVLPTFLILVAILQRYPMTPTPLLVCPKSTIFATSFMGQFTWCTLITGISFSESELR
jgi:hypothetical protein